MSQLLLPRLSEERFAALQAQCHLSAEAIEHLVAEIHEADVFTPCGETETSSEQHSGTAQENTSL